MPDRFPMNLLTKIVEYQRGDWMVELSSDTEILTHLPPDFVGTLHYLYDTVLTERERKCMLEYYDGCKTLDEVAKMHGVTRERIRQVLAKALRKLRHPRNYQVLRLGLVEWNKLNTAAAVKGAEKSAFEQGVLFERNHAVDTDKVSPEAVNDALIFLRNKLSTEVDHLGLSVRARNCLIRANILTVETLIEKSVDDMKRTRNMGRKILDEILLRLQGMGLIDRCIALEHPSTPMKNTVSMLNKQMETQQND